jgi:hypothetical protein
MGAQWGMRWLSGGCGGSEGVWWLNRGCSGLSGGCGGLVRDVVGSVGDVVAQWGIWWLSRECGGSQRDVVAQTIECRWPCGGCLGSVGNGGSVKDVVAQWGM